MLYNWPYNLPVNVPYNLLYGLPYNLPRADADAVSDVRVKGVRPRRLLPHDTLPGRHGDARPEVPPAFPRGDVLVLDFPQECVRLGSFGGQKPRAGVGRRRAPGGARTGAQRAAHRAHDGSLPPRQRSICTVRIGAGSADTLVLRIEVAPPVASLVALLVAVLVAPLVAPLVASAAVARGPSAYGLSRETRGRNGTGSGADYFPGEPSGDVVARDVRQPTR